jgi:hypothetical protein
MCTTSFSTVVLNKKAYFVIKLHLIEVLKKEVNFYFNIILNTVGVDKYAERSASVADVIAE